MKKVLKRSVLTRTMKKLSTKVGAVYGYVKICDYVLHPLHTDALTLLLFSLRTWTGWLALGWLLALYLFLRLRQRESPPPRKAARPKVRNHKKCKPARPAARKKMARRKFHQTRRQE